MEENNKILTKKEEILFSEGYEFLCEKKERHERHYKNFETHAKLFINTKNNIAFSLTNLSDEFLEKINFERKNGNAKSFYSEVVGKNKQPELKIDGDSLIEHLSSDFGIFLMAIDSNKLKRIFIQIENNVISEVDIGLIRNIAVQDLIQNLPDKITTHFTKEDLRKILRNGIFQYLNSPKLETLPIKEIQFLKDTKDNAFFFFKNGFVECNSKEILLKPYTELRGFIWKSQIINHKIELIPESDKEKYRESDFATFIKNICSLREPIKVTDNERCISLHAVMGHLLHNFKNTSSRFAVIFTEANIQEDKPQGRTGKSLILQAISKIRKVSIIDGKNFSYDSQFAFQSIDLDTLIIFFDDVIKKFNFQRLFSAITEGISFEKKNKDRITLTPENSPIICISSNYAIPGESESDKDRKFEMELLPYFNSSFKPVDEFKKEFFYSWNKEEWDLFYNFMISCVQIYLKCDCIIPPYNSDTLAEKKLINATSSEFCEFADSIERDLNISCSELYTSYLNFTGIEEKSKDAPGIKVIGKWLRTYCEYNKIGFESKGIKINGIVKKCYRLVTTNLLKNIEGNQGNQG